MSRSFSVHSISSVPLRRPAHDPTVDLALDHRADFWVRLGLDRRALPTPCILVVPLARRSSTLPPRLLAVPVPVRVVGAVPPQVGRVMRVKVEPRARIHVNRQRRRSTVHGRLFAMKLAVDPLRTGRWLILDWAAPGATLIPAWRTSPLSAGADTEAVAVGVVECGELSPPLRAGGLPELSPAVM